MHGSEIQRPGQSREGIHLLLPRLCGELWNPIPACTYLYSPPGYKRALPITRISKCAKYHRSQLHIEGSGDGYIGTWVVTKTTSGAEKHKKFCTQCGCTLWTVPMNHAGENVIVRAALTDDG